LGAQVQLPPFIEDWFRPGIHDIGAPEHAFECFRNLDGLILLMKQHCFAEPCICKSRMPLNDLIEAFLGRR